jgi:hypothetical protein
MIVLGLLSAVGCAENSPTKSINIVFINASADADQQQYYDLAAAYFIQKGGYEVLTGVQSFLSIRNRLQSVSEQTEIAELIIVSHGSERKGISLPFGVDSSAKSDAAIDKLNLKIQQIRVLACGVGRQQQNLNKINEQLSTFIQSPPKVTSNKGYQVFWYSEKSQKVLTKEHDYVEFMVTPQYNWQSEQHISFIQRSLDAHSPISKQTIKSWFHNQRDFAADNFTMISDFKYVIKAYNQDLKLAGSVDKYLLIHPIYKAFKNDYFTFGKIQYRLDKTDKQFTNISIPLSSVKVFY